jgi:threonylcarbamoyladenosine tRNA methylthiotransferase MtaB
MHGFTENYVRLYADYNPLLVNKITGVKIGEYNEDEMAMEAVFGE